MSIQTDGKSLVDLLNMLEPAPDPAPISMLPQTWGWAVLATILVVLALRALWLYLRHRRQNAYRRQALKELDRSADDPRLASEILRRTALVAFPRQEVAGLFGDEWLSFLRQTSDRMTFSGETWMALGSAPYKAASPNKDVTRLVRTWITLHKSGGAS
ncbi:DUF4381 domain-containing protein [Ruegeria sp. HKCCA6707]|uniref:DUF4381 domain-containing protein n=1 Tax=Ruegeria sp. HKCCA6707 TaxID=2682996 RepID=UPI001488A1C3|nr:DUF4381 domain-containing protein [Ruegeria sp. HKCCA6707]